MGDDAERAEPDAGGGEQLGVLGGGSVHGCAVGEHEVERGDLGGQPAEPGAGAVRAGGDGPGDGLGVDVPEVRQRQAVRVERGVEGAQRGAGADPDAAGRRVQRLEARPVPQVDRVVVGGGERGERVAAAAGPQVRAPGGVHRGDDVVDGPGEVHVGRGGETVPAQFRHVPRATPAP